MLPRLLLLFTPFAFPFLLNAQAHDHGDEDHDHHRHEIGVGNSAVYFLKEKSVHYGLHVHYSYAIPHTKIGVGAGYEIVFSEHRHNMAGLTVIYQPVRGLNLNLMPGLAFHEGEEHIDIALHFETSYEFMFGDFHIGPSVSVGWDPEDTHLGLGIHVGYGF